MPPFNIKKLKPIIRRTKRIINPPQQMHPVVEDQRNRNIQINNLKNLDLSVPIRFNVAPVVHEGVPSNSTRQYGNIYDVIRRIPEFSYNPRYENLPLVGTSRILGELGPDSYSTAWGEEIIRRLKALPGYNPSIRANHTFIYPWIPDNSNVEDLVRSQIAQPTSIVDLGNAKISTLGFYTSRDNKSYKLLQKSDKTPVSDIFHEGVMHPTDFIGDALPNNVSTQISNMYQKVGDATKEPKAKPWVEVRATFGELNRNIYRNLSLLKNGYTPTSYQDIIGLGEDYNKYIDALTSGEMEQLLHNVQSLYAQSYAKLLKENPSIWLPYFKNLLKTAPMFGAGLMLHNTPTQDNSIEEFRSGGNFTFKKGKLVKNAEKSQKIDLRKKLIKDSNPSYYKTRIGKSGLKFGQYTDVSNSKPIDYLDPQLFYKSDDDFYPISSNPIEEELEDYRSSDELLQAMLQREEQSPKEPSIQQQILEVVNKYLGIPYKFGGKSMSGIDCSGFTSKVMQELGFNVEGGSSNQWDNVIKKPIENVKVGDLIFLKGTIKGRKSDQPSHVGIVTDTSRLNEGILIVSEASGKKSAINEWDISKGYYKNHLLGVGTPRRILNYERASI